MTFDEWFQEQFGRRPSSDTLETLRKRRVAAEVNLTKARELYDDTALWDANRATALYAWQARGMLLGVES